MTLKHEPITETEMVCRHYAERDGCEIRYVCTSDLVADNMPADIFYRTDPHPEFGNRYFGIYYDAYRDATYICNADIIESKEFGVVENDEGELVYSQSRWDYKAFRNGNTIDGGRAYIRGCGYKVMKVVDGEFVDV